MTFKYVADGLQTINGDLLGDSNGNQWRVTFSGYVHVKNRSVISFEAATTIPAPPGFHKVDMVDEWRWAYETDYSSGVTMGWFSSEEDAYKNTFEKYEINRNLITFYRLEKTKRVVPRVKPNVWENVGKTYERRTVFSGIAKCEVRPETPLKNTLGYCAPSNWSNCNER